MTRNLSAPFLLDWCEETMARFKFRPCSEFAGLDLHQLANALAPRPRLVNAFALLTVAPQPVSNQQLSPARPDELVKGVGQTWGRSADCALVCPRCASRDYPGERDCRVETSQYGPHHRLRGAAPH